MLYISIAGWLECPVADSSGTRPDVDGAAALGAGPGMFAWTSVYDGSAGQLADGRGRAGDGAAACNTIGE